VRVSRRGGWPATAPRAEHEAPPAGSPVGCRDTPFAGIGCAQAAARYYRHAAADSSVARNGGPTGMARSAGSAPGSGPGGGGDDRSAMSSCRQDRYRPGRRWRIDLAGLVGVHDRLACGGSRKPRVAVPRRPYAPGLFLELGPPATRHPVTSPGPWPIWVGRQSSANSRTQGLLLNPVTARWPDSRGTPARGPRR
jgi:hypothetical protein